jgi:hypothetical protein
MSSQGSLEDALLYRAKLWRRHGQWALLLEAPRWLTDELAHSKPYVQGSGGSCDPGVLHSLVLGFAPRADAGE